MNLQGRALNIVDVTKGVEGSVSLRSAVGEIRHVRIARSFRSRLVGLLNRSSLEADEGLLFDPGGSIHTLWMRFPIDVIFLDEQLRIVAIAANIKPWRFVWAPPTTRFVLELAAGCASHIGLQSSMTLRVCR